MTNTAFTRALRGFVLNFVLRSLLVSWIATGLCAHARAQASSDSEARAHFKLGEAYYDKGRFAEAAAEFDEAYRISQKPQLLYNIYLADRDANRMQAAAEALRGYLAAVPSDPRAEQLRARLAALDLSIRDQEAAAKAEAANAAAAQSHGAVAEQPTKPAETAPAESPTPSSDAQRAALPVLPIVFWSTGGALLIAAGVTQWIAANKHSDLQALCPNADCTNNKPVDERRATDLASQGKTFVTASYVLLASGVVSAGVGTALFFLGRRRSGKDDEPSRPAPIAFGCGPDRCVASLRGDF